MKLKSGYNLYEVNRGKVHIFDRNLIYWSPRYLCSIGYSISDKNPSKNNVVETDLCKNCLKAYRKRENK